MERFDRRDTEAPFMGPSKLKQSKLLVMVLDLSTASRVYMFIDGLPEPLHGLVKSTKPTTLQYAIERDRDLQDALPRENSTFQQKPTFPSKGNDEKAHPSKESQKKAPLSDDVRRDLRRRKLCFTCQESWAPRHGCAAGKAHYIEVFSDDEVEPEGGHSIGIVG